MSDADDQMGGTGGPTGRRPGGDPPSEAAEEARSKDPRSRDRRDEHGDEVTEASEESFPASDPPARY